MPRSKRLYPLSRNKRRTLFFRWNGANSDGTESRPSRVEPVRGPEQRHFARIRKLSRPQLSAEENDEAQTSPPLWCSTALSCSPSSSFSRCVRPSGYLAGPARWLFHRAHRGARLFLFHIGFGGLWRLGAWNRASWPTRSRSSDITAGLWGARSVSGYHCTSRGIVTDRCLPGTRPDRSKDRAENNQAAKY